MVVFGQHTIQHNNNTDKANMAANSAATHNDADAGLESSDPRFSSLCGLTSFVTNSEELLKISRKLTPDEVSVLSLLITSSQAEYLAIREELPSGTATRLGSAISATASMIRTLTLGRNDPFTCDSAPELFRMLSASANSTKLEQLVIAGLSINDWCECNSLAQFSALSRLTIWADETCSRCLPSLVASIGKLRTLESLIIQKIAFTDPDIETLVAALKSLPLIAELSIRHAKLRTGRQIGSLVAMGKLRKLDLSGNLIDNQGISETVDAILVCRRHSGLQELMLGDNKFGPEGERKVAELVACSPRLRILNLKGSLICETFLSAAGAAAATQSLEKLNVGICELGPQEVGSMLDTPHAFPALSVLILHNNRLEGLGTRAIARFILASGWRTLRKLNMNRSDITEAGALELATAFSKAYVMQTVEMLRNPIGPRGATAIIDALTAASTTPMDKIDFEGCQIEDDGASAAGRLIARRGCRLVYLRNNLIHTPGAKATADSVVASMCRIQTLILDDNPIYDEGVKNLLDAIITVQ